MYAYCTTRPNVHMYIQLYCSACNIGMYCTCTIYLGEVLIKLFDVHYLQSNEQDDGPGTVLDVLAGADQNASHVTLSSLRPQPTGTLHGRKTRQLVRPTGSQSYQIV